MRRAVLPTLPSAGCRRPTPPPRRCCKRTRTPALLLHVRPRFYYTYVLLAQAAGPAEEAVRVAVRGKRVRCCPQWRARRSCCSSLLCALPRVEEAQVVDHGVPLALVCCHRWPVL